MTRTTSLSFSFNFYLPQPLTVGVSLRGDPSNSFFPYSFPIFRVSSPFCLPLDLYIVVGCHSRCPSPSSKRAKELCGLRRFFHDRYFGVF